MYVLLPPVQATAWKFNVRVTWYFRYPMICMQVHCGISPDQRRWLHHSSSICDVPIPDSRDLKIRKYRDDYVKGYINCLI